MTDLKKDLCWIYGLSYQIKESSLYQKLYYESLWNRLREVPSESAVYYSSRLCCNTVHFRSTCSMIRVWPQYWQVFCGPWLKIWDFVALVWPFRSRFIITSTALVRCWNLGGSSVCFCAMYINIPFGLNPLFIVVRLLEPTAVAYPVWPPAKRPDEDNTFCVVSRASTGLIFLHTPRFWC